MALAAITSGGTQFVFAAEVSLDASTPRFIQGVARFSSQNLIMLT
jgi:hypothetical protein